MICGDCLPAGVGDSSFSLHNTSPLYRCISTNTDILMETATPHIYSCNLITQPHNLSTRMKSAHWGCQLPPQKKGKKFKLPSIVAWEIGYGHVHKLITKRLIFTPNVASLFYKPCFHGEVLLLKNTNSLVKVASVSRGDLNMSWHENQDSSSGRAPGQKSGGPRFESRFCFKFFS